MAAGKLDSRWFALADLGCAALSGVILYGWPGFGWQPILIALLPWGLRVIGGRFPFKRTVLDLPLAVFLITAGVGVWAAYDQTAAMQKFWILASAVLLFYAMAGQPEENMPAAAGLLGVVGALIAANFLLGYDWSGQPADLGVINRLGSWWMSTRPGVPTLEMHANTAGGVLAMLLPFPAALGMHAWADDKRDAKKVFVAGGLAFTSLLLIASGLLMSSSRGAWIALAGALSLLGLWALSQWIAGRMKRSGAVLFGAGLLLLAALAAGLLMRSPGGAVAVLDRLPGLPSGGSRLDLARNTLFLIEDFPFTGGGLGSFAGLYSQYILVIPYFFYSYSHNLFLDVAVEQGLLGILAFLAIFILLLIQAMRWQEATTGSRMFKWAGWLSLIVVASHGLIDDALYGGSGTPLLLAAPGFLMAAGGFRDLQHHSEFANAADGSKRRIVLGVGIIAFLAIAVAAVFYKPMLAKAHANLGALEMARVELQDFPRNEWDDGSNVGKLAPAATAFNRALVLNPSESTAHHRLGLIEMLARDFPTAVEHLKRAAVLYSTHPGVRKNLGYSYVWTGQYEKAETVLRSIPEAEKELEVYAWWWGTRGQDELAAHAEHMEKILK